MSDKQTEPNQSSPDVPEWFLDERPVLLGELYFLEDERCEVERAGRDAEVDLVVRLKEDVSETSVGVIVRGDVMTEGDDTAESSQSRPFSLSSLELPDPASLDDQPVIVLFFDMATDEGYGQILPVHEFLSVHSDEEPIYFTNLRDVQPGYLTRSAIASSSETERDPVELPSLAFLRATTLNRKGTLLLSIGDHGAARSTFQHALNLLNVGEHPKLFALTLSNLAQVHHELGQLEQADSLYDKALSIMSDVDASSVEPRSSSRSSTLLGL